MDKIDFIRRIINLYPHAIKDFEAQFDTYNRALKTNESVDYEKLYDLFCAEYKDSFPPPPGLLNEWAKDCYKQGTKTSSKWIQVNIYNPIYKCEQSTDCFPAGTSEQAILNYYKKRFGGEGWRIVEVY